MRRSRRWGRPHRKRTAFLILLAVGMVLCFAEHRLSSLRGEIQRAALESFARERISAEVTECLGEAPAFGAEDFKLDTYALAKIKEDLTGSLRSALTDTVTAWVPIGNLSGVSLLNGFGFSVPVFFRVEGIAAVEYSSTLESAGINRTRYGVTMRIIASLFTDSLAFPEPVTVSTEYPLFEAVTSGEVPEFYAGRTG